MKTATVCLVVSIVLATAIAAAQQPADALDAELFRPTKPPPGVPLGRAAVSEEDDPVGHVAEQMRLAETRLRQNDVGPQTQALQADAVRVLRALASAGGEAQAKTAPKKSPAGGELPATTPNPGEVSAAAAAKPPPTAAELATLTGLLRGYWGELPKHARDHVLARLPAEEFEPKYRRQIEAYFRRLAEADERGGR